MLSLDGADAAAGRALERVVIAHHRRRLRALGHGSTLDANGIGWATAATAPRDGNRIEVLIDGGVALPAIAAAIQAAQRQVHIAGWHVAPDFAITHAPDRRTVRALLAATAERVPVRVLAWAGAPVPLFHPWRGEVRRTREALVRGTNIECLLDGRERPMHCHHEKLVVIDDQLAFVGGIDLTDLAGDRFDRSDHLPRTSLGWHDAALRIEGPLVADVAEHFRLRWEAISGARLARPQAPSPHPDGITAQVVRTVPEHVYEPLPRGEFTIAAAYLGAIRAAQHLVYLESQFLWSPEVVALLADKLRTPPSDHFRIVVVLPEHPNNGGDDTRGQLAVLLDADAGQRRFLACTVSAVGQDRTAPVYVHAKVGIVDDRWLTVGSANLNEHSFFNDTEMNIVINDAALARRTRLQLWAEHLRCPTADLEGDATAIIDTRLRTIAFEQRDRVRRGLPRTQPLLALESSSRRIERLLGPLQGTFVDG